MPPPPPPAPSWSLLAKTHRLRMASSFLKAGIFFLQFYLFFGFFFVRVTLEGGDASQKGSRCNARIHTPTAVAQGDWVWLCIQSYKIEGVARGTTKGRLDHLLQLACRPVPQEVTDGCSSLSSQLRSHLHTFNAVNVLPNSVNMHTYNFRG